MEQTMKELMAEIKETTKKQKSANKIDEIRVMRAMLNDPDFQISIYDKNKGYIGSRCPHENATEFVANVCSAVTGIDNKSASELASNYEFTKKDAIFMLETSRDFTNTYLETGRKLPMIQNEKSQAELFVRPVEAKEKAVPGENRTVKVAGFDKIICRSKNPKYNK